jgi:glucose-1-phosphate adenylyltransferase
VVIRNDVVTSLDLPRRAAAIVLAGGRGTRLLDLTARRSKPAVYFGGKFRIVDFALSNAVNSGVRRIAVLTQYTSHSLIRHIQLAWGFLRGELNEFVQVLPANQRMGSDDWYQGTADAVHQNREVIRSFNSEYTVILAGDHVYKMNYAIALAHHAQHGRGCTVACVEVPREQGREFGIMAVGENDLVADFVEKPADPPSLPGKPDRALASMGIYIFDTAFLLSELERDAADPASSHDFGRDLLPRLVREQRVVAHRFETSVVNRDAAAEPYWRDVGTLDAYWDANIDLTATVPLLDLYDERWPIWTYQPHLPGHRDRIFGLGRLHRLGHSGSLGAFLRRTRALVCASGVRRAAARGAGRTRRTVAAGGRRSKRANSPRPRGRRGSRTRCTAIRAQCKRGDADHPYNAGSTDQLRTHE